VAAQGTACGFWPNTLEGIYRHLDAGKMISASSSGRRSWSGEPALRPPASLLLREALELACSGPTLPGQGGNTLDEGCVRALELTYPATSVPQAEPDGVQTGDRPYTGKDGAPVSCASKQETFCAPPHQFRLEVRLWHWGWCVSDLGTTVRFRTWSIMRDGGIRSKKTVL
jgi:hypothetical protein